MLSVNGDFADFDTQSSFNMVCNNSAILCVVVPHTEDDAERRWEGSEEEGRGFAVKARA